MIRKLVLGTVAAGAGYLGGMIFGYRAAVVDYVENDAETIQSMARTMYDTRTLQELSENDLTDEEIKQLPEGLRKYVEEGTGEQDEEEDGSGRGFQ